MFIYKWFNLLIPILYVVFAVNSMENIGDVHKIFESMCGISASINVSSILSMGKMTIFNSHGDTISIVCSEVADMLQQRQRNRAIETDGRR